MANVKFRVGTRAQYDALSLRDANTLYWLTDTLELRKGDFLYGVGANASASAAGLLSAEDKVMLDKLVESGIAGLHAADASVAIDSDENGKTIGVKLSKAEGNVMRLEEDGLFVPTPEEATVPEYAIERQGTAEDGYSATYKLKRTLDGVSTYVGDEINIPKDMVIESGSLKTVEVDDEPYEGAKVGDKYIDIVLNDEDATHIYIPVSDLVDNYTAGDGIAIKDNVISVTNRTVRELGGTNGKALVFNESDGGGTKFEHKDGTWSYVGVNDGGEGGITGQLYSVKQVEGKYVGTRLNMTNGAFYYLPNSNSSAFSAENELATKGDINAAALEWEDM